MYSLYIKERLGAPTLHRSHGAYNISYLAERTLTAISVDALTTYCIVRKKWCVSTVLNSRLSMFGGVKPSDLTGIQQSW